MVARIRIFCVFDRPYVSESDPNSKFHTEFAIVPGLLKCVQFGSNFVFKKKLI